LLYPFVIEPLTSLTTQRLTWSYIYIAYIILALLSWIALDPESHDEANTNTNLSKPRYSSTTRWILLSMASSSLLFAATNLLSMEIGSIPLIWTPPLAAYLISFIITFNGKASRFNTRLEFWLPEIAATALVLTIYPGTLPLVIIPVFFLFVIANKRLYELRPDPINLSYFYLCIAFGGWLGGVAVSIVAPMLFTGITEYPISILAITILCVQSNHLTWWSKASRLQGYPRFLALIASCLALTLFYWLSTGGHSIRNFYGTYRIRDTIADVETESYRSLIHGRTIHGRQYLAEGRRKEPLAYYSTGGGLEQAMGLRRDGNPVAMIGLGAGGAIPWFRKGDDVSIMEIDPDVEKLARNYFTFLGDTQANIRVAIGDARITLARETLEHRNTYDVLLIDAFSGDGIPTHLLTLEALDIYLSRIPNDGLLIFHITNRFFDLKPVLLALAKERGLQAVFRTPDNNISNHFKTDPSVIVMSHQPNRMQSLLTDPRWRTLETKVGIESLTAWTDDQINVLAPLFLKLRTKWPQ